MIAGFEQAGVDVAALADQLQREGAEAFVASWNDLLDGSRPRRRHWRRHDLDPNRAR